MISAEWSREAASVVNSVKFGELPDEAQMGLRRILGNADNKASLPPRLVKLVDECLASGSRNATSQR